MLFISDNCRLQVGQVNVIHNKLIITQPRLCTKALYCLITEAGAYEQLGGSVV